MGKLLFIPIPEASPSNERTYAIWSALDQRYDVIGIRRKAYFGKLTEKASTFYYTLIFAFLVYSLRVLVLGIRQRKDLVAIVCEDVWYGFLGILLSRITRRPVVCDVRENLYRTYQIDRHSPLMLAIWLALEKLTWYCCSLITTGSDFHKRAYSSQGIDTSKVLTIPLSVDLNLVSDDAIEKATACKELGLDPRKRRLLCVGDRRYFPNWEVAVWINQELAPALSDLSDSIEIIFGSGGQQPPNVARNVKFVGNVRHFSTLSSAADIGIVPNWTVNGVLTRLLDFLGSGKPVVVTKQAARWVPGLLDGVNVLICQDQEDFKKKTISALQNPEMWDHLGQNARRLIEQNYNWNRVKQSFYRALEDVVCDTQLKLKREHCS